MLSSLATLFLLIAPHFLHLNMITYPFLLSSSTLIGSKSPWHSSSLSPWIYVYMLRVQAHWAMVSTWISQWLYFCSAIFTNKFFINFSKFSSHLLFQPFRIFLLSNIKYTSTYKLSKQWIFWNIFVSYIIKIF